MDAYLFLCPISIVLAAIALGLLKSTIRQQTTSGSHGKLSFTVAPNVSEQEQSSQRTLKEIIAGMIYLLTRHTLFDTCLRKKTRSVSTALAAYGVLMLFTAALSQVILAGVNFTSSFSASIWGGLGLTLMVHAIAILVQWKLIASESNEQSNATDNQNSLNNNLTAFGEAMARIPTINLSKSVSVNVRMLPHALFSLMGVIGYLLISVAMYKDYRNSKVMEFYLWTSIAWACTQVVILPLCMILVGTLISYQWGTHVDQVRERQIIEMCQKSASKTSCPSGQTALLKAKRINIENGNNSGVNGNLNPLLRMVDKNGNPLANNEMYDAAIEAVKKIKGQKRLPPLLTQRNIITTECSLMNLMNSNDKGNSEQKLGEGESDQRKVKQLLFQDESSQKETKLNFEPCETQRVKACQSQGQDVQMPLSPHLDEAPYAEPNPLAEEFTLCEINSGSKNLHMNRISNIPHETEEQDYDKPVASLHLMLQQHPASSTGGEERSYRNSILQITERQADGIEEIDMNSPERNRQNTFKDLDVQGLDGKSKKKKASRKGSHFSNSRRPQVKFSTGEPYLEYLPNMLLHQMSTTQAAPGLSRRAVSNSRQVPTSSQQRKSVKRLRKDPIVHQRDENQIPHFVIEEL